MNFRELTEGILNESYGEHNNVVIPLIPSAKLDLSEFYSFKITPSSLDSNITSPKRTFPFLKGKSDPTPSEEDTLVSFMYGDELTFEEALHYAKIAANNVVGTSRRVSTIRATKKIFDTLERVPGVFHVIRTPKDTTFIFRVSTSFLRQKRINKDLQDVDTTGFEDLL